VLRRQFETYLDKVFGFADLVDALPEGRKRPLHPWKTVFNSVFLGSACQFATLHRIEFESREGVLSKRIGPISEDTLGYAMQRQDIDSLFALGCTIAQRLKRNGVLGSKWALGRIVARRRWDRDLQFLRALLRLVLGKESGTEGRRRTTRVSAIIPPRFRPSRSSVPLSRYS